MFFTFAHAVIVLLLAFFLLPEALAKHFSNYMILNVVFNDFKLLSRTRYTVAVRRVSKTMVLAIRFLFCFSVCLRVFRALL